MQSRRATTCAQYPQLAALAAVLAVQDPSSRLYSGDEGDSDDEEVVWYTVNQPWRSDMVRYALLLLDLGATFGNGAGVIPQQLLSARQQRTLSDWTGPVATGLPRDFYDQDWLNSLSEEEVTALKLEGLNIQAPLDLEIPMGIRV